MAHIFGVLAVLTFLLSFQFKTRRNIIIVNLTSRLFYILQYIFLGAFEGVVLDFMGFVLSILAGYKEKEFFSRHIRSVMIKKHKNTFSFSSTVLASL